MQLLVQGANPQRPADWQVLTAAEWATLPFRAEAKSGQVWRGKQRGYVNALSLQGVTFEDDDHYAVAALPEDGVQVTSWSDRPPGVPAGQRRGRVWQFYPLAADPDRGGAINTRQHVTNYADPAFAERFWPDLDVRPYTEFPLPPVALTRHGVLLEDATLRRHQQVRQRAPAWFEPPWTDHLPAHELDAGGVLLGQREQGRWAKAKGTLTYYLSNTVRSNTLFVYINEEQALTAAGGSGSLADTIPAATTGRASFCWTTGAGVPGFATWPTGTYRYQLNVAAAGANLTYGGLTLSVFDRIDSGMTTVVSTVSPTQAAASGTGTKLFSNTWTPAGTTASDLLVILVRVSNGNMNNAQTITLTVNDANSFTDGPWTAVVNYPYVENLVPPRGPRAVVSY